MTDEPVVRRFHEVVSAGNVSHRIDNRSKKNSDVWAWRCAALDDVTRITAMLFPYLGARRQAKIVECLAADSRLA
jgi:hypothetical protein